MNTFPLYKKDGIPSVPLNVEQQKYIEQVTQKINASTYKLVPIGCLCGSSAQSDTLIAEKDRYGFPIASVMCNACGLIRSSEIFDEKAMIDFYSNEYRSIYQPPEVSISSFFEDQRKRGEVFYELFSKEVGHFNGASMFEIGCGAGGILFPFHQAGYQCQGADYNQDYLDFGRSKGLTLHLGDYHQIIPDASQQVILLSHVLEHMVDPIKELNDIFEKLKTGGYLILEVPGVFYIHKGYFSPITYFQNAHVYSFYKDYMAQIADQYGFKVVYGDERCTFILQKPEGWRRKEQITVNCDQLGSYPEKIKSYIHRNYVLDKYKISYHYWRFIFFTTLRKLKLIK
jgi:2-polyprenyl-3-methyl-5-hydroxy-6-metoxy-1,4-benzoquinol methylase